MAAKPRKAKAQARTPQHPPADATAPVAGLRPWWERAFPRLLLGIVAVALLLRLLVSAQLAHTYSPVTRPAGGTDLATYQDLALRMAHGDYDFSQGFYYQPFYYAVYLAAIYKVTGHQADPPRQPGSPPPPITVGRGDWGVIVVQSLLGALSVWLVGMAFARLGGRAVGLLAAAFLALARANVFYTPFTMIAPLQGFWMALLLWLGLRAWRGRSPWLWGVLGLVAGLANLTRGNIVLMLPVFLAVIIAEGRHCRWHLSAALVLFLLGFYVPQLPFSIVNYQASGRWTGPSTAAGAVLALGNTPQAPPGGRDPGSGAGPMDYTPAYEAWMADEREGRQSVGSHIAAWAKAEPLAWLELKWRTFLLFWHRGEIPNNVAIEDAYERVPPSAQYPQGAAFGRLIHAPAFLDFMLLGGLGLAGLLLATWDFRRKPRWWLPVGLLWFYCGSIVAFYMLGRFRAPALPLVCGFAAWTLVNCVRRYRLYRRSQRRMPLLGGLLVLLLSLGAVGLGMDLWRALAEPAVMRVVRPRGVQMQLQPGHWTVLDHGPLPFGGWQDLTVERGMTVTKTLILPDQPGASVDSLTLRLAAAGIATQAPGSFRPTPLALGVSVDGQLLAEPTQLWIEGPGIVWLQLGPLPMPPRALDGRDLRVDLALLAHPGTVALFTDSQRDYGRSQVNSQTQPAELVLDLILHSPTPSTP